MSSAYRIRRRGCLVLRAGCGITAQHVADGGYVAGGPLLASFVLNYTTLSDAWKRLATLAGQVTPYGWEQHHEVNRFVERLSDELCGRGHRVVVVAPSDNRELIRESRATDYAR